MKNKSLVILACLLVAVAIYVVVDRFHISSSNHAALMHENKEANRIAAEHHIPDGSLMPHSNHTDSGLSMDHSNMMVKNEREFLEGMIPHHQEAIDTSREVTARGGSTPEIKKLAEDIIEAQEKEIAMMKDWYQAWYGEAYADDSADYRPMMRDLSTLSGVALDRVFLEDMIMHHMGAIMMAQNVQPYIENQEVADLTKAIVDTQTAEIKQMREMLVDLQ